MDSSNPQQNIIDNAEDDNAEDGNAEDGNVEDDNAEDDSDTGRPNVHGPSPTGQKDMLMNA